MIFFFFDRMIGYGYRTPDILHTLQSFFQGYSEHSAAGPYQLGSTILGCDCWPRRGHNRLFFGQKIPQRFQGNQFPLDLSMYFLYVASCLAFTSSFCTNCVRTYDCASVMLLEWLLVFGCWESWIRESWFCKIRNFETFQKTCRGCRLY